MASRRSAVAPMVDRILRAAGPAGLNAERREDLAVAVAEALSNAVVHGHALKPRSRVRVKVEVRPGQEATVEVRDFGPGFDVTSVSDPTDPSRLLAPGGRGVFLMRRLVDSLEYNKAGNEVRLRIAKRRGRRQRRS
jgi:serine/threonine-protein kinase RsbW